MIGTLLEFQITSNTGVISGENGQHYRFEGSAWRGGNVAPKAGDRVDFAPIEPTPDGRATADEVYLVAQASPPAGPAKLISVRWRWAVLIMAFLGWVFGTLYALDDYYYSTSGAVVYGIMNGLLWAVIVLAVWAIAQGLFWVRRRMQLLTHNSATMSGR